MEVARHGITINCVAPGLIAAGMFMTTPEGYQEQARRASRCGRLGEPEEVAAVRRVPRLGRGELRDRADAERVRGAVPWLLRSAPSAMAPSRSITVDNPPVNALHPDVGAAIARPVRRDRRRRSSVRAVVLTGAGRHFIAGGDIALFPTLDRAAPSAMCSGSRRMQDALGLLPQPVIAAINGTALGGGSSWRWRATSASPMRARSSASPR